MTCPCGKGESLETCCGPYLSGAALPPTAEALMRSRYTAFATGNVDYILETHDPDRRGDVDAASTEQWSKGSEWLGFELVDVENGGPDDNAGVVEFVAKYKIKGTTLTHRERSVFRKHGNRWVFVDGQIVNGPPVRRTEPRVGRNEPCPCGSGKKYKKCHGVSAA
ncbi:MAG TPA: YchJ family protein [Polyangiaceae bacterium]|nr:YchJ family protein [Polyangiaceae bacterium]